MTLDSNTEKPKTYFIYCVTNLTNGKKYVGQTCTTIKARWTKHCWLALDRNVDTRFYAAIRKYGKEAFEVKQLQECETLEQSNEFERTWIRVLKTENKELGYNSSSGGDSVPGCKQTPESIAKGVEKRRGKKLVTRTRKTDIKHKPVVDGFKSGKTRAQLAEEFNLSQHRIIKILLRWRNLHEPDLPVGGEHQYKNSGLTLQKRALEKNQRLIELFQSGMSRKEVAAATGVSYGQVKQVIGRFLRRRFGVQSS